MLLFLVILGLVSIPVLEAPRLILNKLWRELAVFLLVWCLASFIALTTFFGIKIPPPLELLRTAFKLLKSVVA